ncbi:hypothetical protein [Paenibacillus sedimenti]|uniref:Uncharacterized protein n=1 Tax=Paenibacillus sedimenti TaxID=2770274 RepID=A0A926KTP1_9BACL|nr:hypothetical protein [Paenibacillus sedimenti]MBD0381800.1 hypothetical protein [Paenibacillus sedimenti]
MYERLVKINDKWTEDTLRQQVADTNSRFYGGIADPISGVAMASHVCSAAVLPQWIPALLNPDSSYYRNSELLTATDRVAAFMLNRQHPDGTISPGYTNYNSPPDTAFVIGIMAPVYQLLKKADWEPVRPVAEKLKLFLERSVPAMLTGGCHTPNHRWVITAALGFLYEIFALPELAARADEWLVEGMDITADGEWTERSNGIYNAVSDIALIHTARLLNRPELFEYVRRNLRMMVYLIHPSGEVVTEYSGRQDFGQKSDMAYYFLSYSLMAALDRDPFFAAMSDYAGGCITENTVHHNAMLGYLLFPEILLTDLERVPLPEQYNKIINGEHPIAEHLNRVHAVGHHSKIQHSSMHFAFGSPIVRIRDKEDSVTLMTRTPSFFSLRHGKARLLGVKLATTFLPGVVDFNEFHIVGGVYKLARTQEKGYNGPVPRQLLPESVTRETVSPWYLLPHQHRPATHVQEHRLQVELSQHANEWMIHVKSDEREDVFAQLTFVLGEEGTVVGDGLLEAGGDRYFHKGGSFTYNSGTDAILIEGGAYDHRLPMIREDQHPSGCKYVHVNLLTPFDQTFRIRLL